MGCTDSWGGYNVAIMQDYYTYQIHIGSVGWAPDDARGFYPEDMPPEWRLAYYNNFFSCAYLPYGVWGNADVSTIAGWLDETLPRFRFVLESGSGEATAEDREKLGVFGERLGLLVKGGEQLDQLLWLEDFPAPQAAVQRACEQAGQGNTVFIVSRLANFPAMERITDQLEALQL
jgi:hypothetical protein